jgi:hypothetical protein
MYQISEGAARSMREAAMDMAVGKVVEAVFARGLLM